MQEQLNQIAEETGVPADLLERAARARAEQQGVAVEALVSGWVGGEAPAAPAPAPAPPAPAPAPAPPAPEPEEAPPATAAAAAESGAGKVPDALLRRSAAAKAKREGRPLDEVLVEMGLSPEGASSEAPAAEPPAAAAAPAESGAGKVPDALLRRSAAAKAKREGRPLDEILVEMGLSPEGASSQAPAAEPAAPAPAATAAASPPAADAVEEAEAVESVDEEPQPVFAGFPRWLAASFIIIPMIALLYAGLAPNGPDCGTSGQLAINPISGEAESCDGGASPFFTLGEAIYEEQCVACHGAGGGGGVGPAFTGGAVLQTFSACSDHVEWVAIGSAEWPTATYGDTAKPVLGTGVAMPGYQNTLSLQEIAAVSLYERVAFGDEDIVVAETSCGLVEGAAGE